MLTNNSPVALPPFFARHARASDEVDLCGLVTSDLERAESSALVRIELPEGPALAAGGASRLRHLVTALLAIATRESPQGLGSELTVECLPTHIAVTITSDRVTQTAELGPLLEAFNAYSASISRREECVSYTPRMKVTSCADRRFSRVRVGLPYAQEPDVFGEVSPERVPSSSRYDSCLRAG